MHMTTRAQTDEDLSFQALLSSQRQLLSHLRAEREYASQQVLTNSELCSSCSGHGLDAFVPAPNLPLQQVQKRHNSSFASDWMNQMNMAIGGDEAQRIHHLQLSKRASMGVGNDYFVIPEYDDYKIGTKPEDFQGNNEHDTLLELDIGCLSQTKSIDTEMAEAIRDSESMELRQAGSMPSIGNLFVVQDQESFASFSEVGNGKTKLDRGQHNDDASCGVASSCFSSDDEDYGVYTVEVSGDRETTDNDEDKSGKLHHDALCQQLKNFDSAMERSQSSQQAIHDWDRKMGLKRSHSKTMRLSSRSRKKLRQLMKREILQLVDK